jgi:hypothetical protein
VSGHLVIVGGLFVARSACGGWDQRAKAVFGVILVVIGAVAVGAPDAGLGVSRSLPGADDSRSLVTVAVEAGVGGTDDYD